MNNPDGTVSLQRINHTYLLGESDEIDQLLAEQNNKNLQGFEW